MQRSYNIVIKRSTCVMSFIHVLCAFLPKCYLTANYKILRKIKTKVDISEN